MIINKIEIENFRSIKKKIPIYLNSDSLSTFIGPNNSGKSNVLIAINLFFNSETEPGIKFDPKRDLSIGSKKSSNISIEFQFEKGADSNIIKFIDKNYTNSFKNYFVRITLRLYSNGTKQYIFTTKKGQLSTAMDNLKNRILENIDCVYIPAIKDYKNIINQDMMKKIVASTFQGWGRGKTSQLLGKHKENFQKIIEELQNILDISGDIMSGMFSGVVSSIDRFDFSLPYDNVENLFGKLSFQITEAGISEKVSLDSEGSGIQSYTIYSMLKLLHELRPKNTYKKSKFIWLIEEPETFMHHDLQRKTFNKLKKFSKDGHIFISTHSPIFIDKSFYSNTFLIEKDEQTEVKRVTTENIRKIITGSLGVGFDELGIFNRYNILMEGETDKYLLLELNRLFRKQGYTNLIDEAQTEFIVCGSANSIPHFYDMYNAFNQYGSFYALFDRDQAGISARDVLINKTINKDFLVLIPESSYKRNCEIEDIVDKSIWDKCLNHLDSKSLITLHLQQGKIINYTYDFKNRVKVKREFVNKLLEFAKQDISKFKNYYKILKTFKILFDKEKI